MKDIFPGRFQELIRQNNVKVADMAKELGISKKSLYNFMKGIIFPSTDTISKIADYFGVSTDYLLGRVDEPTEIIFMQEEEPFKDEVLFIRRAYQKMDDMERRIIQNLVKSIIDEKEKNSTSISKVEEDI